MASKFFSVQELRPYFDLGTWTYSVSSNILQVAKVAADETPTVSIALPRHLFKSGTSGNPTIKSIACQYVVATAALDAAATVTVNKLTIDDSTRAVSRAALANTKTVSGTDTTGTAVGTFLVKGALDQPYTLNDNECATAEFAFNCAATTVLTIRGFVVETA